MGVLLKIFKWTITWVNGGKIDNIVEKYVNGFCIRKLHSNLWYKYEIFYLTAPNIFIELYYSMFFFKRTMIRISKPFYTAEIGKIEYEISGDYVLI